MNRTAPSLGAVALAVPVLLAAATCKPNEPAPAGRVDAAIVATPADAGAVDLTQCGGCQLAPQAGWTFEGIYRDDKCTEPLAQAVTAACSVVAALGSTSITYVDEIQARKAGSTATVTLVEAIAPVAARFRKAGATCVRANEAATDVTPAGCIGSRVCRDGAGALTCTGCRTLANGCPDFQETRTYASINDPELRGAKGGGGGGGDALAKLRQCCDALANEAKRQNNAPELLAASAQCRAIVAAAGPSGTAPELATVRTMLAGRNLPAACAGL
jgi:hypothetical protein